MGDERNKTGGTSGGISTAAAASRAERVGRHVEPRRTEARECRSGRKSENTEARGRHDWLKFKSAAVTPAVPRPFYSFPPYVQYLENLVLTLTGNETFVSIAYSGNP